jgi:hypothetical protein
VHLLTDIFSCSISKSEWSSFFSWLECMEHCSLELGGQFPHFPHYGIFHEHTIYNFEIPYCLTNYYMVYSIWAVFETIWTIFLYEIV